MRDFKGMKRQRGRNRGGGNGGGGNGGGGKPQQNANRAFDSNGPDNIKVRGHAQHVFEKYQQLARDATSGGDRVLAENFLQHAEHYFRVLRTIQPNRPISDFVARDSFASGYDIDFEDESGAQALPDEQPESNDGQSQNQGDNGEQRGDYRDQQPRENRDGRWEGRRDNQRDERPRSEGQRNDGQRSDGQREGRNRFDRDRQPRDSYRAEGEGGEAPREASGEDRNNGGYRDQAPREDRAYRDDRGAGQNRQRDDRPRDDRPREDRPRTDRGERRERTYEPRAERSDRDPLAVVEPKAQPLTTPAVDEGSSLLRSRDGEVSHAPAFLQAATPAPAASSASSDDEAPVVKRPRGRPRKVKEEAPADEG